MKKKIHVKVGDQVKIISGFYKYEIGEIIKVNKQTGKVTIQGIYFKFKHLKQLLKMKSVKLSNLKHLFIIQM